MPKFYITTTGTHNSSCTKCSNLRKFNLNSNDFDNLLLAHNNKCAICNLEETQVSNINNKVLSLSLDHCHLTNKVRGLLCHKCNKAIGLLQDNIELLKKSIEYLEKYK